MSENNIYKVLAIDKVGQGNSNNIDNSKFKINVPEPTCYYVQNIEEYDYELNIFIPGLIYYEGCDVVIMDDYSENIFNSNDAYAIGYVHSNTPYTDGIRLPGQNATIFNTVNLYNVTNGTTVVPFLSDHNYVYAIHYENNSDNSITTYTTDIFEYNGKPNDFLTYIKTVTKTEEE